MTLDEQNALYITSNKRFNFDNVNTLEIDGLSVLFNIPNVLLKFSNVKNINYDVLEHFLKYEGNSAIILDGLQFIDDRHSEILGKIRQSLSLNGLISISTESVQNLIKRPRGTDNTLYLNGLKNISDEIFDIITKSKTPISLDGLQEINVAKATSLIKNHKDYVSLNGVTNISNEVSEILIKFKGFLYLNGLKEIDNQVSNTFVKFQGRSLQISKEVRQFFDKSVFVSIDSFSSLQVFILKLKSKSDWIYLWAGGYARSNAFEECMYKYKRVNSNYLIYKSKVVLTSTWEFIQEDAGPSPKNDLPISVEDYEIINLMSKYIQSDWLDYNPKVSIKDENKKLLKKNYFASPYWDEDGSRVFQLISKRWNFLYKW